MKAHDFYSNVLPQDMRAWVGERGLVKLALAAVQTVSLRRSGFGTGHLDETSPQMVLTLVTYCYAANIVSGHEIERAARSDESIRYICAYTRPGRDVIRRFRRTHRQLMEHCISWVVAEAWKLKCTEEAPEQIFDIRLGAERYCAIFSWVREKLARASRLDALAPESV